jgi:hypothetical protein
MPTAVIIRMVAPVKVSPFRQKALHPLKKHAFTADDHSMARCTASAEFAAAQDVSTTSLLFIGDTRIDGHKDLRAQHGLEPAWPIVVLFSMTALLAVAIQWGLQGGPTFSGLLVALRAISLPETWAMALWTQWP